MSSLIESEMFFSLVLKTCELQWTCSLLEVPDVGAVNECCSSIFSFHSGDRKQTCPGRPESSLQCTRRSEQSIQCGLNTGHRCKDLKTGVMCFSELNSDVPVNFPLLRSHLYPLSRAAAHVMSSGSPVSRHKQIPRCPRGFHPRRNTLSPAVRRENNNCGKHDSFVCSALLA